MDTYQLGPFHLDRHNGVLLRGSEPVVLGGRAVSLLGALVEKPGTLVSKDALIEAAWPGQAVEDSNLPVQIAALRRVLGEAPGGDRWIETMPRRGYRFVGPIVAVEEYSVTAAPPQVDAPRDAELGLGGVGWRDRPTEPRLATRAQPLATASAAEAGNSAALATAARLSIVVMPFSNLSNDPEQEYFVDGITEDLTTDLSRISGSFVIARNTAFAYKGKLVDAKQIGRELGVRYVLEGSVRRTGDQVRVNVQLIDAESGAHLWADRFDTDRANLAVAQNEITGRLARTLNLELVAAADRRIEQERAVNPDARDIIMRGWALYYRPPSPASRRAAQRVFEQALELDAQSVDARIGLATIIVDDLVFGWSSAPQPDQVRAEQLLLQALERGQNRSTARHAMGVLRRSQNRLTESRIELETAIALDRNDAVALFQLGVTLMYLGRPEVAIPYIEKSIALNPRDPNLGGYCWALGSCHLLLGHVDQAIDLLTTARTQNPRFWYIHAALAGALGLKGDLDEAKAALADGIKLRPEINSLAQWRTLAPWNTNPQYWALREKTLNVGLCRAGLPVGPVVVGEKNSVTAVPPQVDVPQDAEPIRQGGAERRQITAMSCEAIGGAGRADGTGLEDLREAIGGFQHSVSEIVGRHHGFIVSRFGNTVLVLFGYPEAHEHDAERAIHAGLELCAAVRNSRPGAGMPMRCRVGIATGVVIVGDLAGVGEVPEHGIVGDTPDLALRLRLSAQPDTVTIEPTTWRVIGNLFDCRDLGTLDANAETEPIRRWQVLRESAVASRFEALRGSKLTPLVGRDDEIDLLLGRWARAKAGDGQIVLVSGEAGIGKSRIAEVFEERLRAEPHLRLRYFCSPHHQDSTLFPVIDQLGRAAGLARGDLPASTLEKLEALLALAAAPDEDVAFLADLMSLPTSERHPLPNLSPQRKKERTLQALIRQLEGLAREKPVVAVFEDAHWLDPTSRELLDLTVERVRSLSVLLIVTFRPEFEPPWAGQPRVSMLVLNRLDQRERMALIEQIADGGRLPHEIVSQIADRTDGVPLFVEELTKSVLESVLLREENDRYLLDPELPPLAIPMTLRASLLARLDRLGSARHVAQIGAVIGGQFSYPVLRAVSRLPEDELRAALARLVASELVFQRGTAPDSSYSFKHALVQDAAYDSLLRAPRQQLHAQIAEALENHTPEITENQPELLAQRYAEAGLTEKSVACWGKAGHRSAARLAMAEAIAQLQKGLDQLALLPDTPERQRQELEFRSALSAVLLALNGPIAPETAQAQARVRELWETLGSPSEFLWILYGQSVYHMLRGELDRAQSLAKDLLRLSRQRNDTAGLVLGHYSSGRNLMFAGKFTASRSHLEAVLALYDPIADRSLVHQTSAVHPQVGSRGFLGIVQLSLGYPDQALAWSDTAIAEDRRLVHPPSLANSLALGTILLSLVGGNAAFDERTEELVALANEQGFPFWGAIGTICLGWVRVKNGDVAEGMSLLRDASSAYRATGTEAWMPYFIALLASASEIAGKIEEAATLVDEALQLVERTGERWFVAELNRQKAQLLRRQGYAEAAERLYRRALNIARKQEAKLWELRAALSLARLRCDQGRRAEAHNLLAPVYGWFTEGFDTADLKDAKGLLDELT
jgi:TolB-like protein/DNA-binding winged helix-turn-helix (wHTH) protein/predicted ATPase/class 3 adenylate cyclase